MAPADGFCVHPFLQLHLTSRGTAKPCCAFEAEIGEGERLLSVRENSVDALWNSSFMREVRRKMIAGERVAECGYCARYQARGLESVGRLSTRGWAQGWMNPEMRTLDQLAAQALAADFFLGRPEWIDLHVGNACNLQCRMCCGYYSSRIAADSAHSAWEAEAFDLPRAAGGREGATGDWTLDEAFLFDDLLQASSPPRILNLIGGEPTLVKAARRIMRRLSMSGAARAIHLSLTTNATAIDEEWRDLARAFRSVTVAASIDGLDRVNHYIRHPAQWRAIESGLALLRRLPNVHLYVNATVQAYNALDIAPLAEWCDEAGLDLRTTLLEVPKFLSPEILPAAVRREAILRLLDHAGRGSPSAPSLLSLAQALERGEEAGDADLLRRFMIFTNDLDAVRDQDFAATFPALLRSLHDAGAPWIAQRRFAP